MWLRKTFAGERARRVLLCVVAVALCYLFDWHWLRALTCSANIMADRFFGVQLTRLSADQVMWHGGIYHYAIACTFADAWCGALAFLWRREAGLRGNLQLAAELAVALFFFNIARLTFSDVLVAHGASWTLGHSMVSGLSYFALWTWISRHNAKPKRLEAYCTVM